jgi:hypothetical protein
MASAKLMEPINLEELIEFGYVDDTPIITIAKPIGRFHWVFYNEGHFDDPTLINLCNACWKWGDGCQYAEPTTGCPCELCGKPATGVNYRRFYVKQ